MSRSFSIYLATVVAVLSLSRPAESAGPEVLAQQMADGNRAAIAAVRSLACRSSHEVVSESRPGQAAKWLYLVSSQYWRSPDRFRVRTPRPTPRDFVRDRLIRDGKCWVLNSYSTSGGTHALLSVEPDLFTPDGDVWEHALFHHWGGLAVRKFSYADLLAKASRVHAADRVTDSGRELIHVRLAAHGDEYEFWFDPAVNYLIRKHSHIATSDPSARNNARVFEVIRFVEPARGVFFPAVVEHKPTVNGQLDAVIRTTLSDVQVNHDIPAALRLPNIAGMTCYDYSRNTDYTVDADGNRTGPELPTKVTSGGVLRAVPDGPPPESRPPSRPPWSLWLWVLIAAGCAFSMAGIVWYVRRRRNLSSSAD